MLLVNYDISNTKAAVVPHTVISLIAPTIFYIFSSWILKILKFLFFKKKTLSNF